MPKLTKAARRYRVAACSDRLRRRERDDCGVIMIIWMMSLTALVGFMAVAFAAGQYVQSSGNFQNAADAAALEAASIVGQSSGPLGAAEQMAADRAKALALSYGQLSGADWLGCTTPNGFQPGDAAQTDCVAFAQASGAQTLVSRAAPVVSLAAPDTLADGGQVAANAVVATVAGVVSSGGTGNVSFYLYGSGSPNAPPPSCVTDTGILPPGWSALASVPATAGTAQYTLPSADVVSLAAGYYWWEAYYDGSGTNNLSESSGCTSEQTIVTGVKSIGLSAPDRATMGEQLGGSDGDVVAQLTGTTGSISGDTVGFYVYGPSVSAPAPSCSSGGAGWQGIGNLPVTGNGAYTLTTAFAPTQAGHYWWDAVFTPGGGDHINPEMHSSCSAPTESVVGVTAPHLSLSAPSSAAVDSSLPLSGAGGPDVNAQLSGTSGNTNGDEVTFYESGPSAKPPACFSSAGGSVGWAPVDTAPVNGDGRYYPTNTFTPTSEGDYWWDAVFSTAPGDTTNGSADSSCSVPVRTVVEAPATTPALSLSVPNTAVVGQVIDPSTVVSDISGLTGSGGKITFYVADPASNDATCPGTAGGTGWVALGAVTDGTDTTYTLGQAGGSAVTLPSPGELAWYASYGGDSQDGAAGTGCGVVTWVEVPGHSPPTILGTSINVAPSISYAVYSDAGTKAEARLCYYPGNCATA